MSIEAMVVFDKNVLMPETMTGFGKDVIEMIALGQIIPIYDKTIMKEYEAEPCSEYCGMIKEKGILVKDATMVIEEFKDKGIAPVYIVKECGEDCEDGVLDDGTMTPKVLLNILSFIRFYKLKIDFKKAIEEIKRL